jgi:pimeloyl-ACP methyl ester carboxylesterase
MRFLCLHGMGTNSDIYEAQLAPIIAQLDPSHEFVFVDGLVACEPADGVDSLFPGPFYCYYDKPVTRQLEDAYKLLIEVMEEDGPFDGVFGFSQGGALAASFILHHQANHPHDPDLFRVAVFTCASLPFDPNSANPKRQDPYHASICPRTGSVHVEDWKPGRVVEAKPINGFLSPLLDGEEPLHRFHPAREKSRISVPTVHILGACDPFCPQSRLLADLCAESVVVEHRMGHLLPRDMGFAQKAARAIDNCIHKALARN